jgi:5-hydroxyisourate hydrolase
MTSISTHVLDTSRGVPAAGVRVQLYRRANTGQWHLLSERTTNADGRVPSFLEADAVATDVANNAAEQPLYRLAFDVDAYFATEGQPAFFPEVQISFRILDQTRHHHVPLLLSPFSYSTYRGS